MVLGCGLLVNRHGAAAEAPALPGQSGTNVQTFVAEGVVKELKADGRTVVIAHEAIAHYMDAMTMPFKVKEPGELAGLRTGDKVRFRLSVTDTESWVDGIIKTGSAPAAESEPAGAPAAARPTKPRHPLLDYPFINELGQVVRLGDFQGQALAITFFFTRCPIPDYCPRLSKNFEEASQKLSAMPGAPTNWHFLSVTFDPDSDTPAVLKAYGESYRYDPKHWSFLTGPREKISELASQSDVKFEAQGSFFNHNFRTLIIDPAGHLQMVFPTGGNLSDAIVAEVLKAAAVTSRPAQTNDGVAQAGTAALAR
jgi:protein SCO1